MLSFQFTPFPVLSSERLLLCETTIGEAPDFLRMRSDPRNMRYLDRPLMQNIAEAHEMIGRIRVNFLDNITISWTIRLKETNHFIGHIGYYRLDKVNHRAEVGYMLEHPYWRLGYASEALRTVLQYGFSTMHLHSVQAAVNPDNEASIGVLSKNGFLKEGHFKEDYYYNGNFLDTGWYALLASQFAPK